MVLRMMISAAPANGFTMQAPLGAMITRSIINVSCFRRDNSTAAIDVSTMTDAAVHHKAKAATGALTSANAAATDISLNPQGSPDLAQPSSSTAPPAAARQTSSSSMYGFNIHDRKRLHI